MPVFSPRLPSSFFLSLLVMPFLRTGPGETARLNELAMPPESGNARPVHRS